ncbi:hypothetical protein ACWGJQ_14700 [Peribacillus simplex]
MMNLSLWSLKQDIFRLEEREHELPYPVKRTKNNRTRLVKLKWIANTTIATLAESSTMFWVGYITAFSNDEHFSTIDSLQKIIPEKVIEFGKSLNYRKGRCFLVNIRDFAEFTLEYFSSITLTDIEESVLNGKPTINNEMVKEWLE